MAFRRPAPVPLAPVLLLACIAAPLWGEEPLRRDALRIPSTGQIETSSVAALGKPVPETVEDLLAIERQVRTVAEKVSPATVGLRVGRAQGSGVIVSKDGYVLTAAHVIGKPDRRVTIVLPDGREVAGKTLGLNHAIDAGLVKITEKGDWPHAEMGEIQTVDAGDWCIATGHPGGYRVGRTPVLRLGRVIMVRGSVVQTDCTLVGGDSGGPLFDMDGKVIGVNSRIGTSTAWNFHVPISAYSDDWDRLVAGEEFGLEDGPVAVLGVSGDDHPDGCKVTEVARGYPAEDVGVRVGDIITRIDGQPIRGFDGLAQRVRQKRPGDDVTLEIVRGGETIRIEARLARRE